MDDAIWMTRRELAEARTMTTKMMMMTTKKKRMKMTTKIKNEEVPPFLLASFNFDAF